MKFFKLDAGVLNDLEDLVLRRNRWIALACSDMSERYHRAKLGILWASLSILIFVGAVSPIYANLFNVELSAYALHLMLGLMIWNFLFTVVMESTKEFIVGKDLVSSFRMGFTSLVARVVARNVLVFFYQFLAFLGVSFALGNYPTMAWLIGLPGLVIVIVVGFFLGLLIGVIATRYRDLAELFNNLFRLIFFATPVMWMPNLKPDLQWVVQWNPYFYLIEWVRAPLTNQALPEFAFVATFIILSFTAVFASLLFVKLRRRLAFWL